MTHTEALGPNTQIDPAQETGKQKILRILFFNRSLHYYPRFYDKFGNYN